MACCAAAAAVSVGCQWSIIEHIPMSYLPSYRKQWLLMPQASYPISSSLGHFPIVRNRAEWTKKWTNFHFRSVNRRTFNHNSIRRNPSRSDTFLSITVSISLSFPRWLSGCAHPSSSRTDRCKCTQASSFRRYSLRCYRAFVSTFHASIPTIWMIFLLNIVPCWPRTIHLVVTMTSMVGSIISNAKSPTTSKLFGGLFKMWFNCENSTKHSVQRMLIWRRKSRTSTRRKKCSTRFSKATKLTELKCKTSSVSRSEFFVVQEKDAFAVDLDRLSAKISAQALALKENNAKITNYEKELARVIISCEGIFHFIFSVSLASGTTFSIRCVSSNDTNTRNRIDGDEGTFEQGRRIRRNSSTARTGDWETRIHDQ